MVKDLSFKHALAGEIGKVVTEAEEVSMLEIRPEEEVVNGLKDYFVGFLHFHKEAKLVHAGFFFLWRA